MNFATFDERFPALNLFIQELVDEYHAGKIVSWAELDQRVRSFFTPECMDQMDALAPGWKRMASYADGITLTHVSCVFLGLVMLPEYAALTAGQQQLAKWIVLFHDVAKDLSRGQRDFTHGFRSAVCAAESLPRLGFQATSEFHEHFQPWSVYTTSATMIDTRRDEPIQDNTQLPEILAGIEQMFGVDAPATLIVKGVLLHMSINVVKDWPQPAPLTEAEIRRYVNKGLLPLLKVMCLSDNEGWSMFHPTARAAQRHETVAVFQTLERLIR